MTRVMARGLLKRVATRASLLTSVVGVASVIGASAQDWPRFRGPNGSGIHPTARPPVEFGPARNVSWSVSVPFSRSSPVLGGPCVFLTASEGDELITICIDRSSGAERWRRSVFRARTTEIYASNDATSPSPVTDDDAVYVFFPDFGLVAYSHEGTERWRLPLGPFNQFFGMASSPILVDGAVVLLCDQQTNSFLLFVNARDGTVRARVPREHGVDSMATPAIVSPADGPARVVVFGSRRVDGYDATTGKLDWWAYKVGYGVVSSPVVSRDRVYVNVPAGDSRHLQPMDTLIALYDRDDDGRLSESEVGTHEILGQRFGSYDPNHDGFVERDEYGPIRASSISGDYGLVALELGGAGEVTNTHFRWRHQRNLSGVTTPLVYRGVVYIVKNGGIVTSLDAASGEVQKTGRATGALGAYYASPVAADGKIFLVSRDCDVTVLDAGAQWDVSAVNSLADGDCYATPAIDETKLYLRTSNTLYAFAQQ